MSVDGRSCCSYNLSFLFTANVLCAKNTSGHSDAVWLTATSFREVFKVFLDCLPFEVMIECTLSLFAVPGEKLINLYKITIIKVLFCVKETRPRKAENKLKLR